MTFRPDVLLLPSDLASFAKVRQMSSRCRNLAQGLATRQAVFAAC